MSSLVLFVISAALAAPELLENGDFSQPLGAGWQTDEFYEREPTALQIDDGELVIRRDRNGAFLRQTVETAPGATYQLSLRKVSGDFNKSKIRIWHGDGYDEFRLTGDGEHVFSFDARHNLTTVELGLMGNVGVVVVDDVSLRLASSAEGCLGELDALLALARVDGEIAPAERAWLWDRAESIELDPDGIRWLERQLAAD